jgi:MFS family permease
VASRAYGRIGPKRLIIAGFVVQLIIGGLLQLQNLSTPLWVLTLMLATQGVAMGLLMTPVQTATFAAISGPAMGMASSMFNVTRQVATALGTAVVATVLTVLVQRGESTVDPTVPAMVADAQMSAFHGAFLVSVVFAVLGIVLALRVRDADAAATLDRPKAAARQGEPEPSEP